MKKLIILTMPLLLAACATTQDTVAVAKAGETQEVAKVAVNKAKLKCTNSRATGSQMKKKRCWTKKEYDKMQEESKDTIRKAIDQGGTRRPIN